MFYSAFKKIRPNMTLMALCGSWQTQMKAGSSWYKDGDNDSDKSEADSSETSVSSSSLLCNNNNGCDIDDEIISIYLKIWRNDKCNLNLIERTIYTIKE